MTHSRAQRSFVIGFNLFTILLWGWIAAEFLTRGTLRVAPNLADLYLIILSFYAGDKEIRRWRHRHTSTKRRGEYFVMGWVATLILALGAEIFGGGEHGFVVPHTLPLVVGGVVIIYFITQYLKVEYKQKY